MVIETQKYVRKAFEVDVAQVSAENLAAIAEWCGGAIKSTPSKPGRPGTRYVEVDVHKPQDERYKRAMIGDYILWNGKSFKVYLQNAFKNSFIAVPGAPTVVHGSSVTQVPASQEEQDALVQQELTLSGVPSSEPLPSLASPVVPKPRPPLKRPTAKRPPKRVGNVGQAFKDAQAKIEREKNVAEPNNSQEETVTEIPTVPTEAVQTRAQADPMEIEVQISAPSNDSGNDVVLVPDETPES